MSQPPIPKINEENEIIGETTIAEAVENHWPRRVVRTFVFNDQGKLLIQRRSATIIGYPCYWDQSAGGHVDVGETAVEAALREAKEEINLSLKLESVADAYYIPFGETPTFNYIFKTQLPTDQDVVFDTKEVFEVRWVTSEEIDHLLADEKHHFIPVFRHIWENFRDKLMA